MYTLLWLGAAVLGTSHEQSAQSPCTISKTTPQQRIPVWCVSVLPVFCPYCLCAVCTVPSNVCGHDCPPKFDHDKPTAPRAVEDLRFGRIGYPWAWISPTAPGTFHRLLRSTELHVCYLWHQCRYKYLLLWFVISRFSNLHFTLEASCHSHWTIGLRCGCATCRHRYVADWVHSNAFCCSIFCYSFKVTNFLWASRCRWKDHLLAPLNSALQPSKQFSVCLSPSGKSEQNVH